MNMSRHLTVVLLCTAMLLLNGCASTGPTRFYLLSPIGGDHAGDALTAALSAWV